MRVYVQRLESVAGKKRRISPVTAKKGRDGTEVEGSGGGRRRGSGEEVDNKKKNPGTVRRVVRTPLTPLDAGASSFPASFVPL